MKFIEFKNRKYKNYNLIEGFPSPDLTATITTKYIVEQLKMEKIGFIHSDEFFPVVRINKGLPEHPLRIYVNHKHKLLAILPDQAIPKTLITDYSKALINWSKSKKIKGIFTIAAVNSNKPSTRVYGVTNNKKGIQLLRKQKVEIIKDGMTSGIAAQLLMSEDTLPIYLILGSISTKTSYEVAARILKELNDLLYLNIDTKPLLKQSEKLISDMKKQISNVEKEKEKIDTQKQIMYS